MRPASSTATARFGSSSFRASAGLSTKTSSSADGARTALRSLTTSSVWQTATHRTIYRLYALVESVDDGGAGVHCGDSGGNLAFGAAGLPSRRRPDDVWCDGDRSQGQHRHRPHERRLRD